MGIKFPLSSDVCGVRKKYRRIGLFWNSVVSYLGLCLRQFVISQPSLSLGVLRSANISYCVKELFRSGSQKGIKDSRSGVIAGELLVRGERVKGKAWIRGTACLCQSRPQLVRASPSFVHDLVADGETPAGVSQPGAFYFDNPGAEIGQVQSGRGAGQVLAKFQNSYSMKWLHWNGEL